MNYHLEALGWTLVHFCWQAGAIAVAFWLVDTALLKARSQTRYLLALAAILAMPVAALATLAYEEATGASGQAWLQASIKGAATEATGGGSVRGAPLILVDSGEETNPSGGAMWTGLLPWLDGAWLLGVMCLSARTVGGWLLLRKVRRSFLAPVPPAVRASFARLRTRLGIAKHVELRLSACVRSPLAVGVVRSLILLPVSAVTSLSPEQLEVVLAHELAHVRRADYLWNLLQTTVETLFFFHPAVWWVGRRVRQERELCCDDVALATCRDPLVYATALLRLEEERGGRLDLAMALDGHQSHSGLRGRIGRMLGESSAEKRPRSVGPLPLLVTAAAVALFLLPLPRILAGTHAVAPSEEAQKPANTLLLIGPHLFAPELAAPQLAASLRPAPVVTALAAPSPLTVLPSFPEAVQSTPQAAPVAPAPLPHVQLAPAAPPEPLNPPNPVKVAPPAAPPAPTAEVDVDSDTDAAQTAAEEAADQAEEAAARSIEQANEAVGNAGSAAEQATQHKARADYIEQMRAAGYNVDVDKYFAMKAQGLTPQYAEEMAKAGFGHPSVDDLIAMKATGVTPEYVQKLHAAGLEPLRLHDLIAFRVMGVTPEFLAGMKAAGFGTLPGHKLIALRAQGVTPEYAKKMKQQFPDITVDQLAQLRIFGVNDAFIASAKSHGVHPITVDKLIKLRMTGLLNGKDEDAEVK